MDYSSRTLNILGGMEGSILLFSPGKKRKINLCDFLQPSGYLIAVTETHRAQDYSLAIRERCFQHGVKNTNSYLQLFIQVISQPNGTSHQFSKV